MSNAIDVLLVAPDRPDLHGRMHCVPLGGPTMVRTVMGRPLVAWWNPYTEAWYWVATDGTTPDETIASEIDLIRFPPAWNLRGRPAPESGEFLRVTVDGILRPPSTED